VLLDAPFGVRLCTVVHPVGVLARPEGFGVLVDEVPPAAMATAARIGHSKV